MGDSYLAGGKGLAYLFRVKKGDDDYSFVQLDGVTPAAVLADAALKLTLMQSTKPEPQDDGTLQVTWDNYQLGGDLIAFLNAVAMKTAAQSKLPKWTHETGVEMGGTDTDNLVLVEIIGAFDAAESKYLCHYALGVIKSTSGGLTQIASDWAKPTLVFEGKFTEFDLVVPTALQDNTILTVAEQTISKGYCFKREWIAEAA
jgi:hypothetical protein